jgi:hypothetical protein
MKWIGGWLAGWWRDEGEEKKSVYLVIFLFSRTHFSQKGNTTKIE